MKTNNTPFSKSGESEQGEVDETAEPLKDDDDVTLAETLLNIKRSTTKDKRKGIMQGTELPKKLKKREMIQLSLDEELAQKLHAEELAKETARQEKEREMIQLSLDEELAQKLHAEELAKETARQEKERYNLEKALELQIQLDQGKKDVDKGDQTQDIDWNDPENRGGYKQSYFKGMEYEDIRPIFERVWDQIITFVLKDSEIKKEVMNRFGYNLQQESSKKHKLDEQTEEEVEAQAYTDKEIEEMKLYVKIVHDEDIAIYAIPLATKPSVIVEYKIVKEGKMEVQKDTLQ
nr:hypothetical protein [Tanacetum cinerariifolium]